MWSKRMMDLHFLDAWRRATHAGVELLVPWPVHPEQIPIFDWVAEGIEAL